MFFFAYASRVGNLLVKFRATCISFSEFDKQIPYTVMLYIKWHEASATVPFPYIGKS